MSKPLLAIAAAGLLLTAAPVTPRADPAADYPNHTVRIIVAAPPGGGVDIVGRIVANRLQQIFGQPFVIENHPGAGGNLGAEAAAAAPPDGYTLLVAGPGPLSTNTILNKKLRYDPTAFEPLAIMTSIPNTLVVRADHPANSLAELIAYAKANPGQVNFGSQGIGTTPHLTGELFARYTGTQLVHIPYRGTAPVINDLLSGQLDLAFLQLDVVMQYYREKRLKMLAVTTDERVMSVPEVPTAIEAGLPNFRSAAWNVIAAPPNTPASIVAKLNQTINAILKNEPEMADRFRRMNMTPVGGSPDEVRKFLAEETERWGSVIRAAKITAQ